MTTGNKVIQFPITEQAGEIESPVGIVISGGQATSVSEIPENVKAMIEADAKADAAADVAAGQPPVELAPMLDEESSDPLNAVSEKQLRGLMGQVREMMGMLESQWNSSRQEFQLSDTNMKMLYAYNTENAEPMPADLSQEESVKWDNFNGLNNISEEKALEIFGVDHPIIGVQHTQTVDRIKSVVLDFFSWMTSVQEYRQIHDAYMELIELGEAKEIDKLKHYCNVEQDPAKKEQMQAAIDLYYNRKYLGFLAEPLQEGPLSILIKAFSDPKKIQYWLDRSRSKLNQLKISSKFILEISQFEKRFLPEEFHSHSNILLIYFMNLLVFSDVYDKRDPARNKVACMVFGLDKFIRGVWAPEVKEQILANLITFQQQFVGKLPLPKKEATND